jgi:hypothetical protein
MRVLRQEHVQDGARHSSFLWRCRSEFNDDFQDARGFGWDIPGQPKFSWKTLIQKKVLA